MSKDLFSPCELCRVYRSRYDYRIISTFPYRLSQTCLACEDQARALMDAPSPTSGIARLVRKAPSKSKRRSKTNGVLCLMNSELTLTADDLRKLLALVVRADIKISDVPNVWITVQRLETASKSGWDYVAALPPAVAVD